MVPLNQSSLRYALLALFLLLPASMSSAVIGADGQDVFFREDFNNLDKWKPYLFPKIHKHSTYTVETNGQHQILKAESSNSASAIVYRDSFNVYEHPGRTRRSTSSPITCKPLG